MTIILAGVTFSINLAGVFDFPDAVLYDFTTRYSPARAATPQVLVVAVDPKDRESSDELWQRVLNALIKFEARQILFTFLPPNASPSFYKRAIAAGNIIFGRSLWSTSSGMESARLEPWPVAITTLSREPSFGVVALPPGSDGIYRRQHAWHTVQGQHYPALETQAIRQLGNSQWPIPDQSYWVNFQGGSGSLPIIELARLAQDRLIPELVQGRSVLIGLLPSPLTPNLHTPLGATATSDLPLLVFQGYALETLLHNNPIEKLDTPLILALLSFAVFANLIIYQWGGIRFGLWVTLGFLLVYAISAWLALTYTQRWPPVTALVTVQAGTFLLAFWYKALNEDRNIRSLIVNLSSRSREHTLPAGFYVSVEPWKQVVDLVRQTLDLNWLIFLERIPEQYYVREIAALHCDFKDIDERRRDYRRSPYSDAVAERRTLRLEQRLFLKADATIDQYMAPLLFGGELLGFWAMGVSPAKIAANPDFFTLVDSFRDQIAEILYHRLQWQQQTQKPTNNLLRYLRLEGGESHSHTLNQALLAFEKRLHRLEQVFQSIDTAAIFYNPFGRVLQTNEAMAGILRRSRITAYEMTALDLLTTLCGIDFAEGRQTLQRVFIDHQKVVLPARLPGDAERRYSLCARPVLAAESTQLYRDATEALPFQLQGILIELFDVTTLYDLSLVKSELAERVHRQLRDHFQAMLLALELNPETSREERRKQDRRKSSRLILEQQVHIAVNLLDQAQQYLLTDLAAMQQLDSYPVEPRGPLRVALARLAERAAERQIRINVEMPELISLVMADADTLHSILETLARVLIEDAVVGTELTVSLRQQEQWLLYDFQNQGFGMPNAKFQAWLSRDDSEATPLFRQLRAARRQIIAWKGVLQGASTLGQGIRFVLHLPCFGGTEPIDNATLRSQRYVDHPETKCVLVVDDSQIIQQLVTLSLQKEGYYVRTANNGQIAVGLLNYWVPDLIVLDMMMPVMDGFQFLEWRQQHHPQLPVLALTGINLPDSERQILAAGANAVLLKPIQIPDLLTQISQLVGTKETEALPAAD
jgi:CheY-like chemotaxis protein/CHASE2 domain-containing sensor protein